MDPGKVQRPALPGLSRPSVVNRKGMKILVTGASGYVGRFVVERLASLGHQVMAWGNRRDAGVQRGVTALSGPDLANPRADLMDTYLPEAPEAVIHLAAQVHSPQADGASFERVNEQGTSWLFEELAKRGLKRFVFLSTIGVHGPAAFQKGEPVAEGSPLCPENAYSKSKLAAEGKVRELSQRLGVEYTILRAPLVVGEGAPGNVQQLEKWIGKGLPIPLASEGNRRSFIHVANLADLLALAAVHPSAAGKTFVVADDLFSDTEGLVMHVARQLGKAPKILRMSRPWLRAVGAITRKSRALEQLNGSLEVDSRLVRETLRWSPAAQWSRVPPA